MSSGSLDRKLRAVGLAAARLPAGDVEGGASRVHTHDPNAPLDEHQRKRPGAATHVQHQLGAQLGDDRDVRVEVATVGIQRIVNGSKAGMLEELVGHPVTLGRSRRLHLSLSRRA